MARGLVAKAPDDESTEAQPDSETSGPGEAAPASADAGDDQSQQATPEEQAAYENFIKMAQDTIYPNGRVNPEILKRLALRHGGIPESQQAIEALASTTVNVVIRTQDAIKEGGGKIAPAVMYHAGAAVMEDLADLASKPSPANGGKPTHDYTPEEMKGAWIRAVDQYRQQQTASGDLPKGVMDHDWGQVVGAAKAGNLGSVSPELAQAAGGGEEQQ